MRTRGSRAFPTCAACCKRPVAQPLPLVCGGLKVGGGETAHPTDLAPIGVVLVVATVHGLMVTQPLGCRKTPITL